MKTRKLSTEVNIVDFPNPDLPQLWVKLPHCTLSVVISKRGIDITGWIDKDSWPDTKISKKTYRY